MMNTNSGSADPLKGFFRAGWYGFSLAAPPDLFEQLDRVLTDLKDSDPVEHEWEVMADGDQVVVRVDGRVRATGQIGRATQLVVGVLNQVALDDDGERLHLHSAAVVSEGVAILIAAPSGSGKSTLAAHLVSRGASYLTDETVAVDTSDALIEGLLKPVSVKPGSRSAVEEMVGIESGLGRTGWWQVPASWIGPVKTGRAEARLLVSYRFRPEEALAMTPVAPSTMLRDLLADCMDARRLGGSSLEVAGRLVSRAECLAVSGGDSFATADALLDRIKEPVVGHAFEVLEPAKDSREIRRSAFTQSVLIGGRAVVFEERSNTIVELDEAASVWWQLLDGTSPDVSVDELSEELGVERDSVLQGWSRVRSHFQDLGLI